MAQLKEKISRTLCVYWNKSKKLSWSRKARDIVWWFSNLLKHLRFYSSYKWWRQSGGILLSNMGSFQGHILMSPIDFLILGTETSNQSICFWMMRPNFSHPFLLLWGDPPLLFLCSLKSAMGYSFLFSWAPLATFSHHNSRLSMFSRKL